MNLRWRYLWFALAALAAVLLEGSLLRPLVEDRLTIDLGLIVLVVAALAFGPWMGALYGVGIGFFEEAIYSVLIGPMTLVFGLIGLFVGIAHVYLFEHSWSITTLFTFAVTFLLETLRFAIDLFYGMAILSVGAAIVEVILPAAVLSAATMAVCYWPLAKLAGWR